MEEKAKTIESLINQAKTAVLVSDFALARQLCEQVLARSPESIDAKLILAGLSDPLESTKLLREVLDQEPGNLTARKAMHWAIARMRTQTAAQWITEPEPATYSQASRTCTRASRQNRCRPHPNRCLRKQLPSRCIHKSLRRGRHGRSRCCCYWQR